MPPESLTPSVSVTLAVLLRVCPDTHPEILNARLPAVYRALSLADAVAPLRAAGALAQMAEETEGLKVVLEEPSKANGGDFSAYVGRLGNATLEQAQKYKGRGLFQLTGAKNYASCQSWIQNLGTSCQMFPEVNIMATPEQLEDPKYLGLESAWYWLQNNLSPYADAGSIDDLSCLVNGGCSAAEWVHRHGHLLDHVQEAIPQKTHGIYGLWARREFYKRACAALGISG